MTAVQNTFSTSSKARCILWRYIGVTVGIYPTLPIRTKQEQDPCEPVTPDAIHSFLSGPQSHLIVAVVNDEVVGFILLYKLQRAGQSAAMMLLYEIGAKFRGQGGGTVFMDFTTCRERNIMKIWVLTTAPIPPSWRQTRAMRRRSLLYLLPVFLGCRQSLIYVVDSLKGACMQRPLR